jgi:hypothetical protein
MVKTGKTSRPRPTESTESVSGVHGTPQGPKVAPAKRQEASQPVKTGRKPRFKPPSTMAPPFKDEPAVEREAPDTDELASEGPDLTPDQDTDFSDESDVPDAEYDNETAAEAAAQQEEPEGLVTEPQNCDNPWHTLPARSRHGHCPNCHMKPSEVPPKQPKPSILGSSSKRIPGTVKDDFVEDPAPAGPHLVPAEVFDKSPPLQERAFTNKIDPKLMKQLVELVTRKPSLLKGSSIGEPIWEIVCPDKDVLGFNGCAPLGVTPRPPAKKKPIVATVMVLGFYQDPPIKAGQGCGYVGSTMPVAKVNKAIKALLAREAKTSEPEVEIESKKKPSRSKPPENPDEYFS